MTVTHRAARAAADTAAATGPRAGLPTGAASAGRSVDRWWRWYLGAGSVLIVAGALLPVLARHVLYAVAGVSSVVAIVVGIRRHRPGRARPWWLFAAGVSGSIIAAALWGVEYAMTGAIAFPGWKDPLFLSVYPLLAGGMATWVRRDPTRPRWESLVDAGIVASGIAVLSWTFIVDPFLTNEALEPARVASYVGYAMLDLLLVVLAARLAFSAGTRAPSYLFVLGGAAALLVGDNVYYVGLAWGGDAAGEGASGALWLAAYLLLGTAALHPSMATSTGLIEQTQPVASRARLGLYSLLAALGPGITIVLLATGGPGPARSGPHLIVPLVTATITGALLIVRLGMLARVAHRRAADLDAHALALRASLAEQEALRRQLTYRALHDPLTGLGNRALLQERLEAVLAGAGRHGLLLLDLDGFKDVNDTFGHPAGDALLIEVAARLLAVTDTGEGSGRTLVRLGGDEFAVLVENPVGPEVSSLATAIVAVIGEPFRIAERELSVTTSVGTFTFGASESRAEALRRADLALYAAKAAGKNQVYAYEARLSTERHAHLRLSNDLRQALARAEFTLHYQPVVDLSSGRIHAVEALLRWTPGGTGTPVPPLDFIPVAEQSGLIVAIGVWVLRQACRDARAWHERYGIAVTVNVSGRQLREPDFVATVFAALHDAGLPGSALVLEITETVLVTATNADTERVSALLRALRAGGIRIAVDDFGTGYSSLSYLRQLPVDILKIDRAFTPDQLAGDTDLAFTRAILQLGASLRLESIAEAVETPEQARQLRELACPYAQGYHFSKPLPAAVLDGVLADGAGRLNVDG